MEPLLNTTTVQENAQKPSIVHSSVDTKRGGVHAGMLLFIVITGLLIAGIFMLPQVMGVVLCVVCSTMLIVMVVFALYWSMHNTSVVTSQVKK